MIIIKRMDILARKVFIMNNLYLIISSDNELTNFHLHDILSKIKYEDNNKIVYDLSIDKLSDILDEASMISLITGNKVIIGEDLIKQRLLMKKLII